MFDKKALKPKLVGAEPKREVGGYKGPFDLPDNDDSPKN